MMGLIGKKVGMTQIFSDSGEAVPVTIIKAGPCSVVQKKTGEKDGYEAIQLGFEDVKESLVGKPRQGHFAKAGISAKRMLREFWAEDQDNYKVGDEIKVDIFKEEDLVEVTGTSKGTGFTGVMKGWGFSGGPASHGTHKWHRRPGSIGASAYPSRVFKGKKMPGRQGNDRITCRNVKVIKVDPDQNLLLVKGAVPGSNGGYVTVVKSLKSGVKSSKKPETKEKNNQ